MAAATVAMNDHNLVSDNAFDWSGWKPTVDRCFTCNEVTRRPRIILVADGDRTTRAVYCKRHIPKLHRDGGEDRAKNPFANFTLDHVRDEQGKKITVNSIAELRAAEKRHNFALAVAADDGGTAAAPPQHEPWAGNLQHDYKKKFNRDPSAYAGLNAMKTAQTGVARDKSGTLARLPNADRTV